jgi:hypothetical protein
MSTIEPCTTYLLRQWIDWIEGTTHQIIGSNQNFEHLGKSTWKHLNFVSSTKRGRNSTLALIDYLIAMDKSCYYTFKNARVWRNDIGANLGINSQIHYDTTHSYYSKVMKLHYVILCWWD